MSPNRERTGGGARIQTKPPRKGKKKTRRGLYIALAVVAALIVAVVAAYKLIVVKPALPPTPEDLPGVAHVGNRKEDFFTFLVIGRDTGGGGNTDTMLLASYDIPNQKLNVMSIPRDTMVNIPYDIKKINAVYNYGGGGEAGIQALDEEISQLVGFAPDFQVVVEWEAVGKLVDAIGGVWYDVPRDMDYDDPTQDLHIHIDAGYQKLNGEQAMQVVRFRKGKNGYNTGDLGRIETQQGFLKAVIEQCLQIKNVTKIGQLAEIFTQDVTTNLSVGNLVWFAQQAILGNPGLDMENVNFVTMPCEGASIWWRGGGQNLDYVVPKTDELVALVNECFNPFTDPLDKSELDIMYVNRDGSIGSTTGVVEDKKANTGDGSSSGGGTKTEPVATPTPAETAPAETLPPETAPVETEAPPAETTAPSESAVPAETAAPTETTTPAEPEPPAPETQPPAVETTDPNAMPEGIPIG